MSRGAAQKDGSVLHLVFSRHREIIGFPVRPGCIGCGQPAVSVYDRIAESTKRRISELSQIYCFDIIIMETDRDHIHLLLEYDTTVRVCDLVKVIKQQTTQYLWDRYPAFLSRHFWKRRILWSDGYFACSIGEVSSATIEKYIASQG